MAQLNDRLPADQRLSVRNILLCLLILNSLRFFSDSYIKAEDPVHGIQRLHLKTRSLFSIGIHNNIEIYRRCRWGIVYGQIADIALAQFVLNRWMAARAKIQGG